MAHMRAMIVFLVVVASAIGVQAQSAPEHLVTLNTPTFDLGTDVSKLRRDPDFVPMNEIDWLGPILDADPLLGPVVFYLEMADPSMVSASFLWEWERGPDLPGNGWNYFYKYSQNIPERFRIPGYEARANTEDGLGSVMMIPADPDKDYAVMCDPNRKSGRLDFCSIRASYPPRSPDLPQGAPLPSSGLGQDTRRAGRHGRPDARDRGLLGRDRPRVGTQCGWNAETDRL